MTEARDVLVKRLRDVAELYGIATTRELLREAADAVATPSASDGLPEGWKGVQAAREDGSVVWKQHDTGEWRCRMGERSSEALGVPATTLLAEAAHVAHERFPVVVKVEAPASKWTQNGTWWTRDGFRVIVRQVNPIGGWSVFINGEIQLFPFVMSAEEAMGWADRERPVS